MNIEAVFANRKKKEKKRNKLKGESLRGRAEVDKGESLNNNFRKINYIFLLPSA